MSQGLYSHTTRAIGTILTAAIYNADHQNHITNLNPIMSGGYSDNIAQMQAQANPGDIGAESPAANLAGEIERLRFAIARVIGLPFWYEEAQTSLAELSEGVFPNPIEVETALEPALTLRNPVNDTTEKTLMQWERGSGAGAVAQMKAKGGGINDVTELVMYLGGLEVDRWPQPVRPAAVPPPQGYLGLNAIASPIVADATSSTVYYHCQVGNWVPYFSGGNLLVKTFTPATAIPLHSSHLANGLYDVYAWDDAGTLRFVTGVAWSSQAAGAGSRGAGAGTAELTRVAGLLVNSVAMTVRSGTSTFSMPAQVGIYLGTLHIDGTAGQTTCHISYGQSRKWGVWNAYNRKRISVKAGDPSGSVYNAATWRPSANNTANSITVMQGLPDEAYDIKFIQHILTSQPQGGTQTYAYTGIGWNSTTAPSGTKGTTGQAFHPEDTATRGQAAARLIQQPVIGINVATCLEWGSGGNTIQFAGAELDMLMTAEWGG